MKQNWHCACKSKKHLHQLSFGLQLSVMSGEIYRSCDFKNHHKDESGDQPSPDWVNLYGMQEKTVNQEEVQLAALQNDLDMATAPPNSSKKKRISFTEYQIYHLEREFTKSKYLGSEGRKMLSLALGLAERNIKVWFQNRRMRAKKENKNPSPDSSSANYATNSSYGPPASKLYHNVLPRKMGPPPHDRQLNQAAEGAIPLFYTMEDIVKLQQGHCSFLGIPVVPPQSFARGQQRDPTNIFTSKRDATQKLMQHASNSSFNDYLSPVDKNWQYALNVLGGHNSPQPPFYVNPKSAILHQQRRRGYDSLRQSTAFMQAYYEGGSFPQTPNCDVPRRPMHQSKYSDSRSSEVMPHVPSQLNQSQMTCEKIIASCNEIPSNDFQYGSMIYQESCATSQYQSSLVAGNASFLEGIYESSPAQYTSVSYGGPTMHPKGT